MQDGTQEQMVCQETYGLTATEGKVSLMTKGALLRLHRIRQQGQLGRDRLQDIAGAGRCHTDRHRLVCQGELSRRHNPEDRKGTEGV